LFLKKEAKNLAACREADDDGFLAPAIAGRADVIGTGDPDLLVPGALRNMPIITPAAFLYGQR